MTREARILIVDDEKNIRRTLRMVLEGEGYEVREAETGEEALRLAGEALPDVVLLDVRLPGMDGHATLEKLRDKVGPEVAVIMISGHATIADAVQATKTGAFDFLEKPIDRERLLVSVRNALEHRTLQSRVQELESRLDASTEMLGESPPMQRIFKEIQKVAPTKGRVLITGESGTGKELIARAIHRLSPRAKGPFVKVNCAAIPSELIESELFGHEKGAFTGAIRRKKGRFELAQEGTLFLDEIGDIPPATQVLLLRFLQDHCFERVGGELTIEADVRVVAATNKDLYREVQEGRFRDDLYYRLNVITIHLPPLRERKEDIPALSQHFLEKYNLKEHKRILRFSADAMQTLMDFDWPGNVRQLENAVSHAVILAQGEDIRRRHLPRFLKEGSEEALPTSLAETERLLILRVLKEVGWNKHEAARRLRVSRSTLYSKIRRYGLQRA